MGFFLKSLGGIGSAHPLGSRVANLLTLHRLVRHGFLFENASAGLAPPIPRAPVWQIF